MLFKATVKNMVNMSKEIKYLLKILQFTSKISEMLILNRLSFLKCEKLSKRLLKHSGEEYLIQMRPHRRIVGTKLKTNLKCLGMIS